MSTQPATMLRWRPQVEFPTRLRLVRQQYGVRARRKYSQEQFAEVLGVHPGTYKAWEAGNSRPRDLEAFARTVYERTGADPAWLLGVAEETHPGPIGGGDLVVSPNAWKTKRAAAHRQLALLTAA